MPIPMLPPERRREIAAALGVSEQYVYQILRGLGFASPALARKMNSIAPELSLQDLRPEDWQEIWPELLCKDQALTQQAQAAIKSEAIQPAQEVANA